MSLKQSITDKHKTSEIDDHIRRNFDIKKRLGKGAYGIVWKAIDRKTQQIVAIKKIFDAFRNETDAQRTFREIMFLRAFRNHPNIIQLYSIHRAANHMDIYLSFEFMESDLHNVIKRGSILKDIHKRYVMYQLFNATNYIHSGNVIHRDMKPSNVLVDSKCRCKLADFGLARSVSVHQANDGSPVGTLEPCLTDYVATRWYRAPEILIANKNYTKGIDMWSLGCILGEMIRGRPLFPGSCTVNQVECIISALPEPTEQDIKAVGNGFGSALLNQPPKDNLNRNLSPKLDELLIDSPGDAKHLIKSLLLLDPSRRLTARQALDHKYIEKFRNTSPEIELNSDIVPPFRDDVQLTVSEYRSKLYETMALNEKALNKCDTNKKCTVAKSISKKDAIIPAPTVPIARKTIFSQSQGAPPERKLLVKQASESSTTVANLQHTVANLKKVAAQQMFASANNSSQLSNKQAANNSISNANGNGNHMSYARLTNKLNCCKGCNGVQENGDINNNNIKHQNIPMPRMKNDKQLLGMPMTTSNLMSNNSHSNVAHRLIHRDSMDNLTRNDMGHRLSALNRRNSVESSTGHIKSTLKKNSMQNSSIEYNTCNSVPDVRRQSFDGISNCIAPKYSVYANGVQMSGDSTKNASHSNGRSTIGGVDKQIPHRHGLNNNNTNDMHSNSILKKQYSTSEEYFEVNGQLKTLDDKMRRHKMNVLEYATERQQVKSRWLLNELASRKASKHTELVGLADGPNQMGNFAMTNLADNSKSRLKSRSTNKVEFTYPDYGKTIAARNKSTITSNSNYGIISATDLFKLRSMSEHIS